jgi:hypothetical protein
MGRNSYLGGSTILWPDGGPGRPYTRISLKNLSKKDTAFLLAIAEAGTTKSSLPSFGKREAEIVEAGGIAAWIRGCPARLQYFNACLASLARPKP